MRCPTRKPRLVRPAVERLDCRVVPTTIGPTPIEPGVVGTVVPLNAVPTDQEVNAPVIPEVSGEPGAVPTETGPAAPVDGAVTGTEPLIASPMAEPVVDPMPLTQQVPVDPVPLGPIGLPDLFSDQFGQGLLELERQFEQRVLAAAPRPADELLARLGVADVTAGLPGVAPESRLGLRLATWALLAEARAETIFAAAGIPAAEVPPTLAAVPSLAPAIARYRLELADLSHRYNVRADRINERFANQVQRFEAAGDPQGVGRATALANAQIEQLNAEASRLLNDLNRRFNLVLNRFLAGQ